MSARIQAIFFDAVGTLIHPRPTAAAVYAQFGRKFGSRLEPAEISRRFHAFFRAEEQADRAAGWSTSEERERRRWQNIVAGVLDDLADPAACFAALYEHFSQPQAWSCDPAAGPVLRQLTDRGLPVGLASNYDLRLRSVAAGLEPLQLVRHRVISSEVGWRKPATQFFAAICATAQLPPAAILYVGDDFGNDFEGATHAGFQALLLDAAGRYGRVGERRIGTLEEVVRQLG